MENIKDTYIDWLDAMDRGLDVWCQFTVRGRIKTEKEAREIESMLQMGESDIDGLKSRVKLMGSRDMMKMAQSIDEINITEVLLNQASKELERWEQIAMKSEFGNPEKMAYFFGYRDNGEYVNHLNEKLWALFAEMQIAVINFKSMVEKEENKPNESEAALQGEGENKKLASEASAPANNPDVDVSEHDIILRDIFGEHLCQFIKEARICKRGSDVARLVNWYVREYHLKPNTSNAFNKPLWEALQKKGIETASISTWNNIVKIKTG